MPLIILPSATSVSRAVAYPIVRSLTRAGLPVCAFIVPHQSQCWRTFLINHHRTFAAMDLCVFRPLARPLYPSSSSRLALRDLVLDQRHI